jgi:hypothetical protein
VAKYAKAGIEAHTGKIADCNVLETLIAIAKAESDMFANCKCQNKTAGGGADWGLWQFNDLYLNSYHPYDFYYNARGKLIIPQPDNRTKPRSKDITRSPQPARNVNGKKLVSPDIPRDSLDPNRAAIQAARVARVTNFGAWKASKNNWQPLVSQHKYLSVAKDVGCYAAPLYKRAQTPPDGGE